jgi:hypothetical protein
MVIRKNRQTNGVCHTNSNRWSLRLLENGWLGILHNAWCGILPLGRGRLTGRVVWSRLHKRAQTFEGDTRVFYQTGLVFVDITPEQREALAVALAILKTGE